MLRKHISFILFLILLTSTLVTLKTNPVKSQSTITVPDDFLTIQEAINNANDGDTVYVRNGTYYEHLIINKSLALVGEDRDLTVVDGSGNGEIADIQANNVYIGNFTLQNAGMGGYGAVWVQGYSNAVIRNNTMIDNRHGVCVWTGALNATVSGNLIYNRQPSYADGIRLGLSSGHLVTGNVVLNESTGIGLDWTFNNTVEKNILLNNYIGIGAGNPSYDNVFSENTVANNSYGFLIAIYNSRFFHNSILNNSVQAAFYGAYSNVWDNGYPSGGNYWSDYVGVDLYRGPYQNETGSDGIGDTPYVIGLTNQDNYPFLTPNGWLVNATNLSFSLVPNPAYVGQTVTMVGRLSDRFNSPINNAEIDVYVNGTLSGTLVTNSSGWFSASAEVNAAGTYNVTAVCNVQNYNPSSHTESLIVRPKLNTKVSFTFSPNPVGAGQWVLMAGNLTDAYGSLIGDAQLEVYVKSGAGPWKYVGNISTDSSGKIWVFGRVMSKGAYQVAVLYRGSYKHNLSYHIETLTVNP